MDRPLGQNWPNAYAEMKARHERLREALTEISDLSDVRSDEATQIARAALGADEQSAEGK